MYTTTARRRDTHRDRSSSRWFGDHLVGHASRDAIAMKACEKPQPKAEQLAECTMEIWRSIGCCRQGSGSPDRTGVCCAGRSAPAQCEMVTGPGFSSPGQPDRERTTACRDSSEPISRSDASCVTVVGDQEQPSGESRSNQAINPFASAILQEALKLRMLLRQLANGRSRSHARCRP